MQTYKENSELTKSRTSDIGALNTDLMAIKPKVTSEDQIAAALYLEVHIMTIYKYLRGQGKKKVTAKSLLDFLNKRIKARS